MARITLLLKTARKDGQVKVRIRIRDTRRNIDISHQTGITASMEDLKRFTIDGNRKPGYKIYNRELLESLKREIDLCERTYNTLTERGVNLSGKGAGSVFESEIARSTSDTSAPQTLLLDDFRNFMNDKIRTGEIGIGRENHYKVFLRELTRWTIIRGYKDIKTAQFSPDHIIDLKEFLTDEYKYVNRWSELYEGMAGNNKPTKIRSYNTVSTKLKIFHSFFNAAVELGTLEYDPFKRMRKKARSILMKEVYNRAICLTLDELNAIKAVTLPDSLKEARDCFLVHCTLGQRIGDFAKMTMQHISVSQDGIPFIHYLAEKTKAIRNDNGEIETPILHDSLLLIKKYNFKFRCLSYVSGKSGYNKKIREILEKAGIDRLCAVMNVETGQNEYKPLYELASSKLCRKTYVNLLSECQVNNYIGGLHAKGSTAVEHYLNPTLRDKFIIASAAFNQKLYKVDKNLNIITD